ncbi:MAG: cytochrome B [Gammaproteobacteria bacterium]|nr:cytochrome B [Gammaproteobacteria bacterium]
MSEKKSYLIWDIPTRLFHWLLVCLVVFSWYSIEIEENLDWHFISGYCVLSLLLFRCLWGMIGTRHARFKNFLFKPATIISYALTLRVKNSQIYAGHNPLGGVSVIAMLVILLLQTITGLFASDGDFYFGPLSDYVSTRTSDVLTEIHHFNTNIIYALIILHLLAIAFYTFYKKQKLLSAMFNGKKTLDSGSNQAIENSRITVALVVVVVCSVAVYLLVTVIGNG